MSSKRKKDDEARWFYEKLEAQGRSVQVLADAEERDLLRRADIVWGLDKKKHTPHLFYGLERLEAIVEGIRKPGPAMTLSFLLDFETDEPERLCAALLVVKGSHCYNTMNKGGLQ